MFDLTGMFFDILSEIFPFQEPAIYPSFPVTNQKDNCLCLQIWKI